MDEIRILPDSAELMEGEYSQVWTGVFVDEQTGVVVVLDADDSGVLIEPKR